ncbi:hypothetical protein [Moraxella lacunata]
MPRLYVHQVSLCGFLVNINHLSKIVNELIPNLNPLIIIKILDKI